MVELNNAAICDYLNENEDKIVRIVQAGEELSNVEGLFFQDLGEQDYWRVYCYVKLNKDWDTFSLSALKKRLIKLGIFISSSDTDNVLVDTRKDYSLKLRIEAFGTHGYTLKRDYQVTMVQSVLRSITNIDSVTEEFISRDEILVAGEHIADEQHCADQILGCDYSWAYTGENWTHVQEMSDEAKQRSVDRAINNLYSYGL